MPGTLYRGPRLKPLPSMVPETSCSFYPCLEYHTTSRRMQDFYAIKLPCSVRRLKKSCRYSSYMCQYGSLLYVLCFSNFHPFLMFVVPYILVIYMFNSDPTRCTLYSIFLSSVTDRASSVRVSQTSTCSTGITHQTIHNLWLYAAVVLLMMGANSTRNM
jgi:hypothetical protein